jgi:ABC-2 type transport system ATP-binding protein
LRKAVATLARHRARWRVSLFGDRLHVVVDGDAETAMRTVCDQLRDGGVRVFDARQAQFSLEDVFIGAVERSGEDAA